VLYLPAKKGPPAVCLFRRENHRFIPAGGLAADKAHRVRLLIPRNQAVSLRMPVDLGHNTASLVERLISWRMEPWFRSNFLLL
jgi:hypothetical protein